MHYGTASTSRLQQHKASYVIDDLFRDPFIDTGVTDFIGAVTAKMRA
jgi:hypothetical protein